MQNSFVFMRARKNLTRFMMEKAENLTRAFGFGYVDVEHAPNTYEDLQAAFNLSTRTHCPFPVWAGASDKTIYLHCGANYAFRFWHDAIHAIENLNFTTDDEVKIGMMQVKEIAAYFGADSIEAKMMYADTVEQSLYASRNNGEFPPDQIAFVASILEASTIAA